MTLDASYVDAWSNKAYIVRKTRNGKGIFVPAKLCEFDGDSCKIKLPPDVDFSDKLKKFADEAEDTHKNVDLNKKVRESIYDYVNERSEKDEDFDADEEFDKIYDAHQEEREEKYWQANREALEAGLSDAEASSRARKARIKADEDFLKRMSENLHSTHADIE